MESIVVLLMLLTAFAFVLKLTFLRPMEALAVAAVAALFAGFTWKLAITRSKAQISAWLSDNALMLDTAVVLSIEVLAQIAFVFLSVRVKSPCGGESIKRRTMLIYNILRIFPGILVFAVIFSTLTYLIFSLPGASFSLVAWCFGGCLLVFIPLLRWVFLHLIPERELRMEVFFILNILIAAFGVVATVNGTTAAAGTNEVNLPALGGVVLLSLVCAALGLFLKQHNKL